MIIAVEGVSYAGKSTLIRNIESHYKGRNILIVDSHRNNSKVEKGLRELIRINSGDITIEEELFLFAARLKRKAELINSINKSDSIVIVDRFDISFLVLFHFVRKVPLKIIQSLLKVATGHLKPDGYIFLTASLKSFNERFDKNRNSHVQREGASHFKEADKGFQTVFKSVKQRKLLLNTSDKTEKDCMIDSIQFIKSCY